MRPATRAPFNGRTMANMTRRPLCAATDPHGVERFSLRSRWKGRCGAPGCNKPFQAFAIRQPFANSFVKLHHEILQRCFRLSRLQVLHTADRTGCIQPS